MGAGKSIPVKPFLNYANWPVDRVREVIHLFKSKDFDFGLDSSAVSMLLNCDTHIATDIVDALCRGDTGIINGLALLSGLVLLNEGFSQEEAATEVFGLFDFDRSLEIAMDEMTILLLSSTRAVRVMLDVGVDPQDAQMEAFTVAAFQELGKPLGGFITRAEFMGWVHRVVLASPVHSAVDLLRIFNLLDPAALPAPAAAKTVAEEEQAAMMRDEAEVVISAPGS